MAAAEPLMTSDSMILLARQSSTRRMHTYASGIWVIVLTKTGGKEEADIYLEDFPWDSLLPSETRVFRELLDDPAEPEAADEAAKADKSAKARQAKRAKEARAVREAREAKATEVGETTPDGPP